MSYRFRFAKAEKGYVDNLIDMTPDEIIAYTKEHNSSACEEFEDDIMINCWEMFKQKEIFDFGDCPIANDIIESSQPIFHKNETNEYFSHSNIRLCDRNTFVKAIDSLRNTIAQYFKEIQDDPNAARAYCHNRAENWSLFSEIFSEFEMSEKQKANFNSIHCPYNLDISNEKIVQSGLYEYAIFELVRLYKEFDWSQNYLIFYGW